MYVGIFGDVIFSVGHLRTLTLSNFKGSTGAEWVEQKKASKHSQHLYGKAADIWIAGVSVDALAAYAETLLPGKGGIGRYYTDGFVHVDVREVKSRWVTQ